MAETTVEVPVELVIDHRMASNDTLASYLRILMMAAMGNDDPHETNPPLTVARSQLAQLFGKHGRPDLAIQAGERMAEDGLIVWEYDDEAGTALISVPVE